MLENFGVIRNYTTDTDVNKLEQASDQAVLPKNLSFPVPFREQLGMTGTVECDLSGRYRRR
jgi:hypothetical protein